MPKSSFRPKGVRPEGSPLEGRVEMTLPMNSFDKKK
jgi:hypothetical protein